MSVNDKFLMKNFFEMAHIFQGYMYSKPLDHADGIATCMKRFFVTWSNSGKTPNKQNWNS